MSIRVIADTGRLSLDNWNKALGNKILHVLFTLKIAERHGLKPIIPISSNLDDLFDYKGDMKQLMSQEDLARVPIIYQEQTAFGGKTPQDTVAASRTQFEMHKQFLETLKPTSDFSVKGHFWHYELMPKASTFNSYLGIRTTLLEHLLNKYPSITNPNVVAVHMRDTDFATHLTNIFPRGIMLDDAYYTRAIMEAERVLGTDIEYHLFSDNISRLSNLFKGRKFIAHDDSAAHDWAAMFVIKKIVLSNSSFSWTAALYNKEFIMLPECGYNYHEASGSVPYGFYFPNSRIIKKS